MWDSVVAVGARLSEDNPAMTSEQASKRTRRGGIGRSGMGAAGFGVVCWEPVGQRLVARRLYRWEERSVGSTVSETRWWAAEWMFVWDDSGGVRKRQW